MDAWHRVLPSWRVAGNHIVADDAVATLPGSASDQEILDLARRWVDLLAQDRYEEAWALTAHWAYPDSAGWSPPLMRATVAGYGHADRTDGRTHHRVTPFATASGGPKPRHEVTRWHPATRSHAGRADPNQSIAEVWFDLPLDGGWSDLTATFDVVLRDGRLLLVLDDIHVH